MISPLVQWSIHASLDEGPVGDVSKEQYDEYNLTFLLHSFVHGHDPIHPGPFSFSSSIIQYVNFPMFSHHQSEKEGRDVWIDRFPIFFCNGSQEAYGPPAQRYGILYHYLRYRQKEDKLGFSLSGFAGNPSIGLKRSPRILAFELDPATSYDFDKSRDLYRDEEKLITFIRLRFNAPQDGPIPGAVLPDLQHQLFKSEDGHFYPTFSKNSIYSELSEFWDEYRRACEPSEVGDQIAQALADSVNSFRQTSGWEDLRGFLGEQIEIDPEELDNQVDGLVKFLSLNYLLGFRRILYCPSSLRNPIREESERKSWGGLIVVLKDTVSLRNVLFPSLSMGATDDGLAKDVSRIIDASRFFVDVAGPRALIPDWIRYRELMDRKQADAQSALQEHQIHQDIYLSLLHDESVFLDRIGDMIRDLQKLAISEQYSLEESRSMFIELIKDRNGSVNLVQFLRKTRRHVLSELTGVGNPIKEMNPEMIYPSMRSSAMSEEIASIDASRFAEDLRTVFFRSMSRRKIQTSVNIDSKLIRINKIPNMSEQALYSIISQLYINSVKRAEELEALGEIEISDAAFRVFIKVDSVEIDPPYEDGECRQGEMRDCLIVECTDNCGGFPEEFVPLRYEEWIQRSPSKHNSDCRKAIGASKRGFGYVRIMKYVQTACGRVDLVNVTGKDGRVGARVTVCIPLRPFA